MVVVVVVVLEDMDGTVGAMNIAKVLRVELPIQGVS